VADRFRYAGYQYDAATGLYYVGARWYDPSQGRWLSRDPLGFDAGDVNLYRYVGNSPTNSKDPLGLVLIAAGDASASDLQQWLANSGRGFFGQVPGPGISTRSLRLPDGKYLIVPTDRGQVRRALGEPRWNQDAWTRNVLRAISSYDYHLEVSWRRNPEGHYHDNEGRRWDFVIEPITVSDRELFRYAGSVNGIADRVIETIINVAQTTSVQESDNHCLRWVNAFTENLARALRTPNWNPLQGTRLTGRIVSWQVGIWIQLGTLGRVDSHAAYRITFPDGTIFYIDNGSIDRSHIAIQNHIPGWLQDER
jgi:RHS repeat-associated protein